MDRIFHGYKVRYEILNHYLLPVRASRKINTINIFINLDDLYHKMHKPITDNEFQTTGANAPKQLVSNLMNLIGHYKNWAVKEHMHPTVYLIYTTANVFKNAMITSGYREHFIHINDKNNSDFFFLNSTIQAGYPIIQVVTKYIPHAYAIDSSYLEPSIIPLYLGGSRPADFNLMISRDEYDLQYAGFDNWAIISPKGDNSSFINRGSLWKYLAAKHGFPEEYYFHPDIFTVSKTVLGDKYRNIPKLTRTGWKTLVKYLSSASSDGGDIVLEIQLRKYEKYFQARKIQDTDYTNNLYTTSIIRQVSALLDSDKVMIDQQLTDMQDVKALAEVNNTIFREYPLNLQFLLREAPPSGSVPHDDYFWRKR